MTVKGDRHFYKRNTTSDESICSLDVVLMTVLQYLLPAH